LFPFARQLLIFFIQIPESDDRKCLNENDLRDRYPLTITHLRISVLNMRPFTYVSIRIFLLDGCSREELVKKSGERSEDRNLEENK